MKIEALWISTRTYNILIKNGISTTEQLIKGDEIKGMGSNARFELIMALLRALFINFAEHSTQEASQYKLISALCKAMPENTAVAKWNS